MERIDLAIKLELALVVLREAERSKNEPGRVEARKTADALLLRFLRCVARDLLTA